MTSTEKAARTFLAELEAERARIDRLIEIVNASLGVALGPVKERRPSVNNGLTKQVESAFDAHTGSLTRREIAGILTARGIGIAEPHLSAAVSQVLSRLRAKGRVKKYGKHWQISG